VTAEASWGPATDVFMLGSCLVHVLTGQYLFSEERTYAAFYRRLQNFGEDGSPPELGMLPGWLDPVAKGVLRAMVAARPTRRPPIEEMLSLLTNSYEYLAQIRGFPVGYAASSEFPLTALLWRLHCEDDVSRLTGWNKAEATSESAATLLTVFSEEGLLRLWSWGLLEATQPGQPLWASNPSADYQVINSRLLLRPTALFWKISERADLADLWRETRRVREGMSALMAAGRLLRRTYYGFDVAKLDTNVFVAEPSDPYLWDYRLASQAGFLNPISLDVRWSLQPAIASSLNPDGEEEDE
jgi:hypothetical protein